MNSRPTRTAIIERARKLCLPPGSGWATSKSGIAPLAAAFHSTVFGSTDPAEVRAAWMAGLARSSSDVAVIGVPYNGGTYGLSGACAGPLGVRAALYDRRCREAQSPCLDLGDVPFFPCAPVDEMLATAVIRQAKAVRYGNPDTELPICMLSIHESICRTAAAAGLRLLSIGGDHSITASALMGIERPDVGLIHVDSHPDLSTGRDGLELLHSTWIHYVDQRSLLPVVIQMGVPMEPVPPWIKSRLHRIPHRSISTDPVAAAQESKDRLTAVGLHHVYVSVDIDGVDATEAPATGLPASDGLPLEYLIGFIAALAQRVRIVGADLVEIAPPLSGRREWSHEVTCVTGSRLVTALIDALRCTR